MSRPFKFLLHVVFVGGVVIGVILRTAFSP